MNERLTDLFLFYIDVLVLDLLCLGGMKVGSRGVGRRSKKKQEVEKKKEKEEACWAFDRVSICWLDSQNLWCWSTKEASFVWSYARLVAFWHWVKLRWVNGLQGFLVGFWFWLWINPPLIPPSLPNSLAKTTIDVLKSIDLTCCWGSDEVTLTGEMQKLCMFCHFFIFVLLAIEKSLFNLRMKAIWCSPTTQLGECSLFRWYEMIFGTEWWWFGLERKQQQEIEESWTQLFVLLCANAWLVQHPSASPTSCYIVWELLEGCWMVHWFERKLKSERRK